MKHHLEPIEIVKINGNSLERVQDLVSVEEPLGIRLVYSNNGSRLKKDVSITMRTPGDDRNLTLGFLFSEGLIQNKDQITEIQELNDSDDHWVEIHLDSGLDLDLNKLERHFYTTSSCGVCGKTSIAAVKNACNMILPQRKWKTSPEIIKTMPEKLRIAQKNFGFSGGIHACGIFDLEGNLISIKEDIGRHNALDKLLGEQLLKGEIPLLNHILLLSGRASFELLQKAAMAGFRMVCALGAPSSLAVAMAEEYDITLLGFLKEDRFNIYHAPDRIEW